MFACPAHRGAAILLDLSGDLPFADPFHFSDGHWTASLCILPLEVWVVQKIRGKCKNKQLGGKFT